MISGNNPILFIKREFDRQRFSDAEKNALAVLRIYPDLEGAKILLARSLLAQSKMAEAQRIYRSVLDEKLPTARSLAWSNFGLGQIASKAGQNSAAKQFFDKMGRIWRAKSISSPDPCPAESNITASQLREFIVCLTRNRF